MKLCDAHWSNLKQALGERGMAHLIPAEGSEGLTPDDNDPLMEAYVALETGSLHARRLTGGLALMTSRTCPLCEAGHHGGKPETWIRRVANAQRRSAQRLGLLQKSAATSSPG